MMALDIDHLNVWYGQAHILRDVHLRIKTGQAVAVVGRNGAGKTTALMAIAGVLSSARVDGNVRLNGAAILGRKAHHIARLGLGWVPEDRRIFTDLTVGENLAVGRQLPRPGLAPWDEGRLYNLFPNLEASHRRLAGQLSGGEQQMLAIARALMGNPSVILLDEPCEGLAPRIIEQMISSLTEMKAQGLTLLMSEQSVQVASLICDHVVGMERGQIRP